MPARVIAANRVVIVDYLVKDAFIDTPATALIAHAPDRDALRGGWLAAGVAGGVINADGITASFGNVNEDRRNVIDIGLSDFTLKCTLTIMNGSYVGLCFCHSGGGDTAGFVFYYQPGINNVRLGKDSLIVIASGSPACPLVEDGSVAYEFKVVKSGTSIKCFVDNVKYIDLTDASYNGNYHGIFGWRDNGSTWKNFILEA